MIGILLCSAIFAAIGTLGIIAANYVCAGQKPADDGPTPAVVPVNVLVAANALLGAIAAMRGLPLPALAIVGLACGVLTAIWVSDVSLGIVPDMFTLVPLGAVLLAGLLAGHWEIAIHAVVPALPFAFLAWRTGGIGLGWGDVKLAALGGPLIGMQGALLAFAIGCAAAVIVARIRGANGKPLAFAPYLTSAIALPLALLSPTF